MLRVSSVLCATNLRLLSDGIPTELCVSVISRNMTLRLLPVTWRGNGLVVCLACWCQNDRLLH